CGIGVIRVHEARAAIEQFLREAEARVAEHDHAPSDDERLEVRAEHEGGMSGAGGCHGNCVLSPLFRRGGALKRPVFDLAPAPAPLAAARPESYAAFMAIELRELGGDKKTLKDFLSCVTRVYEGNPNYVRPLDFDISDRLDKKKNPFFEHAEGTAW